MSEELLQPVTPLNEGETNQAAWLMWSGDGKGVSTQPPYVEGRG